MKKMMKNQIKFYNKLIMILLMKKKLMKKKMNISGMFNQMKIVHYVKIKYIILFQYVKIIIQFAPFV